MGKEELKEQKFRTAFTERKRIHAPAGSKVEYRHEPEFDKWGKRVLKKTRAVQIYDIIQSHADECDFNKIIRRAREGDLSALNVMEGHYIDITDAPKTLMESQNMMLKAKKEFNDLPADVRQKFDYDYHNYMGMMFEDPEQFAELSGLKLKWQKEKEAAEARAAWEATTQKAIENIAQGTAFNGEGVKNE